jgi:capsid protein
MNLSSARAMLRECRRGFDKMRKRLVRMFCRPWYGNVIRAAVGAGRLRPPAQWLDRTAAFLSHRWVPPTYGMVDPKTDVEASVAAVAANLSDPYEEAAKQGRDAEQTLEARARFLVKAKEIEERDGLEAGVLTREPNAPSPPANQQEDNADQPKDDEVPA